MRECFAGPLTAQEREAEARAEDEDELAAASDADASDDSSEDEEDDDEEEDDEDSSTSSVSVSVSVSVSTSSVVTYSSVTYSLELELSISCDDCFDSYLLTTSDVWDLAEAALAAAALFSSFFACAFVFSPVAVPLLAAFFSARASFRTDASIAFC